MGLEMCAYSLQLDTYASCVCAFAADDGGGRFELSAWLVLPVAFVYVSYLQHQKDLSDKALAIGVVKDPKVSLTVRRG